MVAPVPGASGPGGARAGRRAAAGALPGGAHAGNAVRARRRVPRPGRHRGRGLPEPAPRRPHRVAPPGNPRAGAAGRHAGRQRHAGGGPDRVYRGGTAMTASTAPAAPPAPAGDRPPLPETLADTGLSTEFITDLLLKALYVQGARTGQQLMETVKLPFPFVDDQLLSLQQRRMVEVRGTSGAGRGGYMFDLTGEGRTRAREALESSQYVGPAPVPLEQYREWTHRQSISRVHVARDTVKVGFRNMVIAEPILEMLGPAINSAKSLFLYGGPGNGKTLIAETISRLLGGALFIPYAIEVEGQI